MATTRHDVLTTFCKLAARDPWFRASLPLGRDRQSSETLHEIARAAVEKLQEQEEALDTAELQWELENLTWGSVLPERLAVLRQQASMPAEDERRYVARKFLRYRIEDNGESLILRLPDGRIVLPGRYSPAIRHALSGDEFAVTDLPGITERRHGIQLVDALIKAGAIVACSNAL